jgi:hypothetical protein
MAVGNTLAYHKATITVVKSFIATSIYFVLEVNCIKLSPVFASRSFLVGQ